MLTDEIKHDPSMVEFSYIVWESKNGSYIKVQEGGLHVCSDNEIANFYAPPPEAKYTFDHFIGTKEVMCLDKYDNKGSPIASNIFGRKGNENRSIDVNFMPCKPKKSTPYN